MKSPVGGIFFDNVTMPEAVEAIACMARESGHPRIVCTANLDHMVTMSRDPQFKAIYRGADFVVADGMPIVWLSRLAGVRLKERVAGSDLFWELAAVSHNTGLKLFFLGGRPGSAELAARIVRQRYPKVRIEGIYCPPYEALNSPEENARIAELVGSARPDVLLVALGSPKQEKWIAAHRDSLGVPVSIGVGGSFEMAAGAVKRAPVWMRRSGCEWLFRLIQEPRRLARRYLLADLPYLVILVIRTIAERFRGNRDYDPSAATSSSQGKVASTKL